MLTLKRGCGFLFFFFSGGNIYLTYMASFFHSGPKPDPPLNVTARLIPKDGWLQISWQAPPTRSGVGVLTIKHYLIEYRTVSHWVPLTEPVEASEDGSNSFLWKTASRGAIYQFRIRSSTDKGVVGEASPIITVHTTGYSISGLIYSISGLIVCTL
jgi:hypothetical protein